MPYWGDDVNVAVPANSAVQAERRTLWRKRGRIVGTLAVIATVLMLAPAVIAAAMLGTATPLIGIAVVAAVLWTAAILLWRRFVATRIAKPTYERHKYGRLQEQAQAAQAARARASAERRPKTRIVGDIEISE